MLTCILMKLYNKLVTIELKNDTVVKGRVINVDAAMNFHLNRVTITVKDKEPAYVEAVSIRGNNIRYIIFPNNLNLDKLMIGNGRPTIKRGKARGRGAIARGGRGQISEKGGPHSQYSARGTGRGNAES